MTTGKQTRAKGRRLTSVLFITFVVMNVFCLLALVLASEMLTAQGEDLLDISLQSTLYADYQADPVTQIAPVSISIVQDVIRDQEPWVDNIDQRITRVVNSLHTPVPSITPPPTTQQPALPPASRTPTPTSSVAPENTLTSTPSATPSLTPTSSQTVTHTPSPSPTPSSTAHAPPTSTPEDLPTETATARFTPTPTPTASLTPTPTLTSAVTRTPTPTASLTPTPTSTSAVTRTSTPTASLTLTPTPTSAVTPTPTSTSAPTSTFTASPTAVPPSVTPSATNTPLPSATFTVTPNPQCSPPDPAMGFVSSFSPPNGSQGVSVDIQPEIHFNQAMDTSTLVYGDRNLIALCTTNGCGNPGDIVPASISISGSDDIVTITPDSPLDFNQTYYIIAGKNLKNSPTCGPLYQVQNLRVSSSFDTVAGE